MPEERTFVLTELDRWTPASTFERRRCSSSQGCVTAGEAVGAALRPAVTFRLSERNRNTAAAATQIDVQLLPLSSPSFNIYWRSRSVGASTGRYMGALQNQLQTFSSDVAQTCSFRGKKLLKTANGIVVVLPRPNKNHILGIFGPIFGGQTWPLGLPETPL